MKRFMKRSPVVWARGRKEMRIVGLKKGYTTGRANEVVQWVDQEKGGLSQ